MLQEPTIWHTIMDATSPKLLSECIQVCRIDTSIYHEHDQISLLPLYAICRI
jgi:hypothetical protein